MAKSKLTKEQLNRIVDTVKSDINYLSNKEGADADFSDHEEDGDTVVFNVNSYRNGGFYTPREGEEDDDFPNFTGEHLIRDTLKKSLPDCSISLQDHEKGLFSVYVRQMSAKEIKKKESEKKSTISEILKTLRAVTKVRGSVTKNDNDEILSVIFNIKEMLSIEHFERSISELPIRVGMRESSEGERCLYFSSSVGKGNLRYKGSRFSIKTVELTFEGRTITRL